MYYLAKVLRFSEIKCHLAANNQYIGFTTSTLIPSALMMR